MEVFEEGLDPVDEFWVEVEPFQGVFYEFEGYAVKGFGEIYLEHETGEVVVLGVLEQVVGVPCHFSDVSSWEVCLLPWVDQFVDYWFQAVG